MQRKIMYASVKIPGYPCSTLDLVLNFASREISARPYLKQPEKRLKRSHFAKMSFTP